MLELAIAKDSSDIALVEQQGKLAQMVEHLLSEPDVVTSDLCKVSAPKPLCLLGSPWADGMVLWCYGVLVTGAQTG